MDTSTHDSNVPEKDHLNAKAPGDIVTNLVPVVDDILAKMGHANPSGWQKYLNQEAHTSSDLGVQRFLINRCFRLILGNVSSENTMDARYCLVDTGEIKDWVRLFRTGVAPMVVRLNLP